MTAAISQNPPFPRGQTFFNGGTTNTTDGLELEGTEWVFEDTDYSTPNISLPRTNRKVVCRIVRNSSGISLLPKRLAALKLTGTFGNQVDGYATTDYARGYPVDEWLPSAGVPANDLFYIVVKGPAMCITSLANMTVDVAIGDYVVAQTAITSQATTAGRLNSITYAGATTALAGNIMNSIGVACTAKTTTGTNASILVDVGKW